MTTTTTTARRGMYQVIIGDLLDLVASQPHQILISSASVAIVSAEAATLIPEYYNVAMALGAEWAYLRGMASAGRTRTHWVDVLNWSALALVVLYGMLWGARKFGAISATPDEMGAWILTAIHIIPVAVLSLSAAMVHRSSIETEQVEQAERERAAEQRRLELEQRRADMELEHEAEKKKLELWAAAQRVKTELKALSQVSQNTVRDNTVGTVAPHQDKENRDMLRARVVQIVTESRQSGAALNVSQAWKDAGLSSRAMWYKLIKEAEQRGEL